MKGLIKILLFFIAILTLSCSRQSKSIVEYDKNKYIPEFSQSFKITTGEDSLNSLITIYNPWQGAEDATKQLLILRDGSNPNLSGIPVLHGDAKRIITMSSTHIAMLDIIDETDRVVGVSGMEYISNKNIQSRKESVPDIGYEGNIDYEKILSLQPDLVLLFGINGANSMEKRLDEFGIPYLYIGDYLEESPLGKSEWMVLIGEITGKRDLAAKKFKEITSKYSQLKELVAKKGVNHPKIMLNTPLGDSWFMPSTQSYVATMVKDAGGDYLYKKDTGSTSEAIDIEEAYRLAAMADLWLNTGTYNTLDELKINYPKFADIPCVNAKNVFNNNKIHTPAGGNDCYESGITRPDIILKDLIKIINPELIEDDFTYYHRLQ